MNGPEIALALALRLWHKTAVPVFVERFMLPLFAGAVIVLALSNPMGFDRVQRITGTIAVIFAAYFFAHTIYKQSQPKQELFRVDITGSLYIGSDQLKDRPLIW